MTARDYLAGVVLHYLLNNPETKLRLQADAQMRCQHIEQIAGEEAFTRANEILNHFPSRDVIELALCESEKLILKPNQLYFFRIHPDCLRCKELEKANEP